MMVATSGQDRFQQQQVQGTPTRKACSVRDPYLSDKQDLGGWDKGNRWKSQMVQLF